MHSNRALGPADAMRLRSSRDMALAPAYDVVRNGRAGSGRPPGRSESSVERVPAVR